jgi:hypothetical protein
MKLLAFFLVFAGMNNTFADDYALPVEVEIPVDHIFVPKGFDSNDNTEIVVTGYLPNLCYQAPTVNVNVVGKEINVELKSLYYSNGACAEMIVPITEKVKIGVIDAGDYSIKVNKGRAPYEQSSIKIAESTSASVDDTVYAYVDYVEKKVGTREVTFKIMNPSDCFKFDKIDWISNDKDTFSVLPKMKQVRSFCPMKMSPLEVKAEVPAGLSADKILLHVRSMHGGSYNTIFDNLVK